MGVTVEEFELTEELDQSEVEAALTIDVSESDDFDEDAALAGIHQGDDPEFATEEDAEQPSGKGEIDVTGLVPSEEQGELVAQMVKVSDIEGFDGGDPPTDEMVDSVRVHGFLQPVRLVPTGKKRKPFRVLIGRRRLKTAKLLDIKEVPALIDPRKGINVHITALAENFARTGNYIGDAKIVWKLLDSGVTEQQIAASSAGLKLNEVRALRDVRKLRPELVEAVEKGHMKPWAARMAARHPADTVQARIVERYKKKGFVTAEDVTEERNASSIKAAAEAGDLIDEMPEDLDDVSQYGEVVSDPTDPSEYVAHTGNGVDESGGAVSDERRRQRARQYLHEACRELSLVSDRNENDNAAYDSMQDALSVLQEVGG